jgi:hypothetical protein
VLQVSAQSPGSPVQTNDSRVTDPRISASAAVYHQTTDLQRQKAEEALARRPYATTRPPEDSAQSQIAKEYN